MEGKNYLLLQARETLGLTQSRLAELTGITQTSISNYENLLDYPLKKNRKKICDVLKNKGYFIIEEKDIFPKELNTHNSYKIKNKKYGRFSEGNIELVSLDDVTDLRSWDLSPLEESTKKELKSIVFDFLENLNKKEIRVLTQRFGFSMDGEEFKGKTLKEISKEFGVHPERIRQIETRALRKLRYQMHLKEEGFFHDQLRFLS